MNVKKYLDSRKNRSGGLDEADNVKWLSFIQEAIDEHFKLIMIRPMVLLKSNGF
jgi:deoxyribose-phosphate aldolase